ncbi:MAG: CHAT domain-containing protein [Pseudomonadota bacterium]
MDGPHDRPRGGLAWSPWLRSVVDDAELEGMRETLRFQAGSDPLLLTVRWREGSAPEARYGLRYARCTAVGDLIGDRRARASQRRLARWHRRLGEQSVLRAAAARLELAQLGTSRQPLLEAQVLSALGDWRAASRRYPEPAPGADAAARRALALAHAESLERMGEREAAEQRLCRTVERVLGVSCSELLTEPLTEQVERGLTTDEWSASMLTLGNRLLIYLINRGAFDDIGRLGNLLERATATVSWPAQAEPLLNNLAAAAMLAGDPAQALVRFDEVLSFARAQNSLAGLASAYGNLGSVYDRLARYRDAEFAYRAAARYYRDARDAIGEAQILCRQGMQAYRLGALPRAEASLGQGAEQLLTRKQYYLGARCLVGQGRAVAEQGDHRRAAALFDRARQQAITAGDRGTEAEALLGQLSVADPEQTVALDAALAAFDFERELAFLKPTLLAARAQQARRGNAPDESLRRRFDEAIAAQEPHSLAALRLRVEYAELLYRRERWTALEDDLPSLRSDVEASVAAVTAGNRPFVAELLRRVADLDSLRLLHRAERAPPRAVQGLVRQALLASDTDSTRSPASRDRFSSASFETMGSKLGELITARQLSRNPEQRRALTAQIIAERTALLTPVPKSEEREARVNTSAQRKVPDWPSVLAGQALLRYQVSLQGIGVWVVTSTALHHQVVAEGDELTELIAASTAALGARAPVRALLESLGERLIAPLLPHLEGVTTLRIAADGPLNRLPFAALRLVRADGGSDYLIERFDVQPLLRWNDPTIAPPARPAAALLVAAASGESSGFPALPYAADELATIDRLLRGQPRPARIHRLERASATRSAVLEALRGNVDLVHLAAHGVSDPDFADLSGIYLESNSHGRSRSPFLGYTEVTQLNLTAELVVLSACETSRGVLRGSDGQQGLARAFADAGARWVLASLWAVEDQGTAVLMTRFYRRWLAGQAAPQALREAQLAQLADDRFRHPYHWSAFQALPGRL